MKQWTLLILMLLFSLAASAQYAPRHDQVGTTAIRKDSNIIKGWAKGCVVTRGWLDIANKGAGLADYGSDTAGIGDNPDIVSLGDSGKAVLSFDPPITNGRGFDFVVFENGFPGPDGDYLEFAHVEASSDGVNYFRFPSVFDIGTSAQVSPFGTIGSVSGIHNLAGKYIAPYGTPFDLSELPNDTRLNKNAVRYVRLIDAVGSVNAVHGTRAGNGTLVNDPYPTPFPSSGFDLDAVGVINQVASTFCCQCAGKPSISGMPLSVGQDLEVNIRTPSTDYKLYDGLGRMISSGTLKQGYHKISSPKISGIYYLFSSNTGCSVTIQKLLWQ